MIGNDVISLSASSDSLKYRCDRFMNKMFTAREQRFLKSKSPDNLARWVWLMWSMKESAYKSYYKQFKKRYFIPKMFECYVAEDQPEQDCLLGNVKTLFQDYSTQSYMLDDCIHTVTFIYERQVIHDYCFPIASSEYAVQAATVRRFLSQELAKLEGCSISDIQIIKDSRGIPQAIIQGEPSDFDVSMSHHGLFGAYAISHGLD